MTVMNEDLYDDLRRFQRIPVQRTKQPANRAQQALDQAKCMRIPRSIVREARALYAQEQQADPISAVKLFVTNLLR